MKKVFLIVSIILISVSVYSENDEFELKFKQAGELYASGNYVEAAKIYSELDSLGFESFNLFYNAGNTFYRLNEIGLSIFYYEKADLYKPGNEDLYYNLEMANLRVKELPAVVPELSVISFLKKLIDYETVRIWGVLSLGLFLSFLVLLFLYFITNSSRSKKIHFLISVILLFLSVVSVIFTGVRYNKIHSKNTAVVVSDEINGNSSPDDGSTVLFRLYEGYKLKLEDSSKEWIEVKLTDGKKAWIKKEHVKIL